jgi:hypothetical protein
VFLADGLEFIDFFRAGEVAEVEPGFAEDAFGIGVD